MRVKIMDTVLFIYRKKKTYKNPQDKKPKRKHKGCFEYKGAASKNN